MDYDIAIFFVLVALMLLGACGLWLLSRGVRTATGLQEAMPSSSLIGAVQNTSKQMTGTLQALPQQVSSKLAAEVQAGLTPLCQRIEELTASTTRSLDRVQGSLQSSHQQLDRILLTLDEEGSLGEWVHEVSRAVEPLERTATAVAGQHETTSRVLSGLEQLAGMWGEQRDTVQTAFDRIATSIEQSEAAEQSRLSDIEARMFSQLENLETTRAAVVEGLDQLKTATASLVKTQEQLAETVGDTVRTLDGVVERADQNGERHRQLLESQRSAISELARWQKEIGSGVREFGAALREVPGAVGDELTGATRQSLEAIGQLDGRLQEFHGRQVQAATEQNHQIGLLVRQQGQALQGQTMRLDEVTERLAHLPSVGLQKWALALFTVQAAALVALVVKFFA